MSDAYRMDLTLSFYSSKLSGAGYSILGGCYCPSCLWARDFFREVL